MLEEAEEQSIPLSPDMEYDDPELQALQKEQYSHLDDGEPTKKPNTEDTKNPNDGEEKVEAKKPDPDKIEPKKEDKQEQEEEEQPSIEELTAKMVETVKADLPEPFHPFVEEYYKNEGKLSKESLEKIKEEHGYDSSMVESYIKTYAENYELRNKAQEAESKAKATESKQAAESFVKTLQETVGGQEEWDAMYDWAATKAPKDVVDRYNRLVDHSDQDVVQAAVETLHAAYKASEPQEPKYIQNAEVTGPSPSVKPFANDFEEREAYQDPRYGRDPNYTEKVNARTAASMRVAS